MYGAAGVKRITIHGDSKNSGDADFRAVYARPWMFHGFDENFLATDFESQNLLQFKVTID